MQFRVGLVISVERAVKERLSLWRKSEGPDAPGPDQRQAGMRPRLKSSLALAQLIAVYGSK